MSMDFPVRKRVVHPEGGRRMTKQSHALATDVNRIMERYIAHGMVPANGQSFVYGDFSDSVSYHEAMNRVLQAQESFRKLPASVRQYCHNDPGLLLDLCSDEENREKLRELGLLEEQMPAKPLLVEMVEKEVVKEEPKGEDA